MTDLTASESEKCPGCGVASYENTSFTHGIGVERRYYDFWDCGTRRFIDGGKIYKSDQCRIRELEDKLAKSETQRNLMLEALHACRDYTDGKTTDPIQAIVSVRRALKAIEDQEQGDVQ